MSIAQFPLSWVANRGSEGLNDYGVSLNYPDWMSQYKLDWDGNGFVTTLYFPHPEVTLSGCSDSRRYDESTSWEERISSTDLEAGVTTQFRMHSQVSRSACYSNW